ncbi:hypothetical protein RJ640_020921 [Escallonia rubra]|uniref:Kinesin motor domain-containing protein n=1 Tax=Escallonia rubra TaxID=112253 RepID=A0AA88UMU4_9ASTE|nr:hypothetical protein RJ640_020921 [Escallonia rubra]
MGSSGGEDLAPCDAQGLSAHEEKIFVAVRVRPLNEREIAKNDESDWECINNNTILFKNGLAERSMFPTAYTFGKQILGPVSDEFYYLGVYGRPYSHICIWSDRVFGCDSSTKQVYEEGAKKVALSALSGINSSVFAYGQTSSGKTYTMCGITEYTVADVYDYIHRHSDREFVLKFSAMEIYNESVRDLLSSDSTPLRLLDDPERGTVVEKLTEVTLRDWSQLKELLSICEAERQIGETSLNETSSRSHQILRLTIESSARKFLGAENSSTLAATVNFVDLAGSERASQNLSAGTRLKEGCHINRSLLTLGTVIRKLRLTFPLLEVLFPFCLLGKREVISSLRKGRNGHIPYRDSKLTRILQNSLGGNARTAIICTMSPAHSHVEQSRNTLLFAVCAKEVSTNAQVNVVMSEKALVKQLQRELARLENELRNFGSYSSSGSASILKEKELLIEKMDKEMKELIQQRDLAQSCVDDLLRSAGDNELSKPWVGPGQVFVHPEKSAWPDEYSASESSEVVDPLRLDVASNTSRISDRYDGLNSKCDVQLHENSEDQFLSDGTSPRLFMNKYFGPDPSHGWEKIAQQTDEHSEDNCKEVRCIEMKPNMARNIKSETVTSPEKKARDSDHVNSDHTFEALKQKIQDMQTTIDLYVNPYPVEPSPCSSDTDMSDSRSINLTRSRSCRAILTTLSSSPSSEKAEKNEGTPPNGFEKDFPGRPEGSRVKLPDLKPSENNGNLSSEHSQTSARNVPTEKEEKSIKTSGEGEGEVDVGLQISATGRGEAVQAKSEKQFGNHAVEEAKPNTSAPEQIATDDESLEKEDGSSQCPSSWPLEFERQRREIIELWEACNIPLVHRTCFFLLFKGDPSDSVYVEVELRRLSFVKQTLSRGSKIVKDGQTLIPASSSKVLNREREVLSKQILKKFSSKERQALYQKWGIKLNSKQRRVQLTRRLWTDTKDMEHIKESAALVAKLVGFVESGEAPKEIFGLSFSLQPANLRSYSWKTKSFSSLL